MRATHGREFLNQGRKPGFVTDRISTDHGKTGARPVRDGCGAIGVEVIRLERVHREGCQRVVTGSVHQCTDLGQRLGLRRRRCRPHEDEPGRDDQRIAGVLELQDSGPQRDQHGYSRPRRMTVGDRPPEKDSASDESDAQQNGERPEDFIEIGLLRVSGMGDQQHQPPRDQQYRGGTHQPRGPRIAVDCNAFGNTHVGGCGRWFQHSATSHGFPIPTFKNTPAATSGRRDRSFRSQTRGWDRRSGRRAR